MTRAESSSITRRETRARRAAWTAVLLCASAASGGAQAPGEAQDHAAAPTAVAVAVSRAIRVDGKLDETSWSAATPVTSFTQRDPTEGAPVSERTEVRILFDEEAIYLGARLFDSSGRVSTRLGRRDEFFSDSDWFTVAFDSYHDHLSEYRFSVNPSGVRRDEKAADDDGDSSWDPVWDAATSVGPDGWTAELRIPLSQLRFRRDQRLTWGIQLIRRISRTNEEAWFAFTPKRERSGVARFGHLVGLQNLEARGRLELLPYVATRAQYRPIPQSDEVGFGNPFADGSDHTASAGVDVKFRLASNLTLDASVNPDFGQVEADPAIINLTAFETQLSERRPFFIEGADIFAFGEDAPQLFYSRRIGAPPPGRVPSDAVYDDFPETSTIVGAAKLTGKLGDWSLGLLEAVTSRERADYVTADRQSGRSVVAPWTNYLVARARRAYREGSSTVGALATALNRRLADAALIDRVRSSAYAAGVDFSHQWDDRAWSVSGFAAGSHILGEPAVITAAQRSSARYYHRPDADHLELDSGARTLSGFAGGLEVSKVAGLHWQGSASFATTSPGYEINDLGFQSRADLHSARVDVEYVDEQPGRVFREWNVELSGGGEWNYGGDRLEREIGVEGFAELLNYWSGDLELNYDFGGLDDRLTRGGPLASSPSRTSVSGRVESDSRKPWTVELSGDYGWGPGGSDAEVELELGLKPASNWTVSLSPSWSRERSVAQFVDAIDDTTARVTFGRRYVFGDLRESEVSVAARVNATFSPTLSLELYARPFVGSGRFGTPKQLVTPRAFRFQSFDQTGSVRLEDGEYVIDPDGAGPAAEFSVEDEDFTFRSLRGNAVLRWEWRAGSTLFLVWHQQRDAEVPIGDLKLRRDLRALGRIPPMNAFTLKISYWLNP